MIAAASTQSTHVTGSIVPRCNAGAVLEAARDPIAIGPLRLGQRTFDHRRPAVMAIVNRTPDSFYDRGATYGLDAAVARVDAAVAEGADIVDIGGVPAGHGADVEISEELRRTQPLVSATRERHPALVISVDTWRAGVAEALCAEGADLINDPWAGADPGVARVAAAYGVGLVCSHSGRLEPRARPRRVDYAGAGGVVADVIMHTCALAERAVGLGVRSDAIVLDPTCDFGKNTLQSLELVRRLDELVQTRWPVLVAMSQKDFIGETLGAPLGDRLAGTLAATAVAVWHGALVVRAHEVAETRAVLDMVAAIRGDRPPAAATRP